MTTITFNEFILTLLTGTYTTYGSQPPIINLYKDDKGGVIEGYLETDQDDQSEPVQDNSGRILYTNLKGTVKINATTLAKKKLIYDDIVNLLKATVYAFTLGSFKDTDKINLHERDFDLTVMYPG